MMKAILIVEDEEAVRTYLTDALTDAGHEVFAAEDGLKALSVLELIAIDLIITDIVMPEMDGIELIQKLRKDKREKIKIIAITKRGRDGYDTYLKIAKKFGADIVLEKPFEINELLEAITSVDY